MCLIGNKQIIKKNNTRALKKEKKKKKKKILFEGCLFRFVSQSTVSGGASCTLRNETKQEVVYHLK